MKTIIIGDIHGCYDELVSLLNEAHLNKENDVLVSIGDLMDRGRKSYEVLAYFISLKAEMGSRCVIIRGNHEDMFLEAANGGDLDLWMSNGAASTIQSFVDHGKSVFDYADWVRENTAYYYVGNGFRCVHAGLECEDLECNDERVLTWSRRTVDRNNYVGKLTVVGHTPLMAPVHLKGNGKSSVLKNRCVYRLPETGLICIDTGCVFGYSLTALVIMGGRCYTVSVPVMHGKGGET